MAVIFLIVLLVRHPNALNALMDTILMVKSVSFVVEDVILVLMHTTVLHARMDIIKCFLSDKHITNNFIISHFVQENAILATQAVRHVFSKVIHVLPAHLERSLLVRNV